MNKELQALVDEAYRSFRGPAPSQAGVCTGCCMEPERARALLAMPVRNISLELMREWMDAATASDFPGETWRHLLPRILELLASGEDPTFVGQEVSLRRGRGVAMSGEQREILDRFQAATLAEVAATRPGDLDTTLCMFVLGGWEPETLAAQLAALPDEVFVPALHQAWCGSMGEPLWTSFWEKESRARMRSFFTSAEVFDRLFSLGVADGPLAELAAAVVDIIGGPDS
ncbi:MAG TPA: hypothetical protein PK095_15665 [Myxococcota bacterium]|nr:hypothetical protein [Myxococcota bacterium]